MSAIRFCFSEPRPSNPFFVTGLPRSKTAWAANWLTTDSSLCFHDIKFQDSHFRSAVGLVGYSGPELVTQFEEIQHLYPQAHWLFIMRDPEEARQAFLSKMADVGDGYLIAPTLDRFWDDRVELVKATTKKKGVMTCTFDAFNSEFLAKAAWKWLLPELPFNRDRWDMLRKLNVQQHVEKKCLHS